VVLVLRFRTLLRRGPLRFALRFRTLRLRAWLLDALGFLTLGRGALWLRPWLLDAWRHGRHRAFLVGGALDGLLALRLRRGLRSWCRGGPLLRFRT